MPFWKSKVKIPHVYKTLKSEKLRYDDKIIWFDLVETEKNKFLLIKKKKKVKEQWQFESSITLPIEKVDEFYNIVGGFRN